MIGPQLGEKYKGEGRESPELLTRDESLRKDAPIREWDKDKKIGMWCLTYTIFFRKLK